MVKCPYAEWIPVENGIINKEYIGYITSDSPKTEHFCAIEYKGNGIGWIFSDENRLAEDIIYLRKTLTFEETEKWRKDHYNIKDPKEQLNLMGLFNDMYDIGDAYHEMWNGWIGVDWYEMAEELQSEDFFLCGIAPAPYDCSAIDDSVAFVAEEENGSRFWCHGGRSWVEYMRKQMRDIYNDMMGIEE